MKYINEQIRTARQGSPLYRLAPVVDPSEKLIEVHLAALKWNLQQRRFGMTAKGLAELQEMSVELLELLKSNMPDKTGQLSGWKIEKAHSILHKVLLIVYHDVQRLVIYHAIYNCIFRLERLFCLDGLKISALKAQSTAILNSARAWLAVQTIRIYS